MVCGAPSASRCVTFVKRRPSLVAGVDGVRGWLPIGAGSEPEEEPGVSEVGRVVGQK